MLQGPKGSFAFLRKTWRKRWLLSAKSRRDGSDIGAYIYIPGPLLPSPVQKLSLRYHFRDYLGGRMAHMSSSSLSKWGTDLHVWQEGPRTSWNWNPKSSFPDPTVPMTLLWNDLHYDWKEWNIIDPQKILEYNFVLIQLFQRAKNFQLVHKLLSFSMLIQLE